MPEAASIAERTAQLLDRPFQRTPTAPHVGPYIANLRYTIGHIPQGERAGIHLATLDLFPRAWCGHRRAAFRAHGICRSKRGAVPVSSRIDIDPPAAIGLAELLCEAIGGAAHEHPPHRIGKSRKLSDRRFA